MNSFEKYLKNSIESHSVESVDMDMWNNIDSKLPQMGLENASHVNNFIKPIISGALVAFLSAFVVLYFTGKLNTTVEKNTSVVINETAENNYEIHGNIRPDLDKRKPENQITKPNRNNNNELRSSQNEAKDTLDEMSVKINNPTKTIQDLNTEDNTNDFNDQELPYRTLKPKLIEFTPSSSVVKICPNQSLSFQLNYDPKHLLVEWNFGDNQFSSKPNPVHIYKESGEYSVKVKVINQITGVSSEEYLANHILVYDVDKTEIQKNGDLSNDVEQLFAFGIDRDDIVEGIWKINQSTIGAGNDLRHQFRKSGEYDIQFEGKDANGCNQTAIQRVYIENEYNLLAPKAFSPNNDGNNDTWIPIGLMNGDKEFTLKIIDKNGQVVFASSNSNTVWDGSIAGTGTMAKANEMFGWIAIVKTHDNKSEEYKGTVLVLD